MVGNGGGHWVVGNGWWLLGGVTCVLDVALWVKGYSVVYID